MRDYMERAIQDQQEALQQATEMSTKSHRETMETMLLGWGGATGRASFSFADQVRRHEYLRMKEDFYVGGGLPYLYPSLCLSLCVHIDISNTEF